MQFQICSKRRDQNHEGKEKQARESSSMDADAAPPTIQSMIENRSDFLGFKNFTLHANLTIPVGPFEVGEHVFLKCGETQNDIVFSSYCSNVQKELGMQYVKTDALKVTYDSIYWMGLVEGSKNPKWASKMTRRMFSIAKGQFAVLPAMVTSFYPGVRVTDLHHMQDRVLSEAVMKKPIFAKDLVQILLFAAYLGIKDAQGFNMLVNVSDNNCDRELGSILLVDMNRANEINMEKSNQRGMAQKMHMKFCHKMKVHILREYKQIAFFMRSLKRIAQRHELYTSTLFDDVCIDNIEKGDTKQLQQEMFGGKV